MSARDVRNALAAIAGAPTVKKSSLGWYLSLGFIVFIILIALITGLYLLYSGNLSVQTDTVGINTQPKGSTPAPTPAAQSQGQGQGQNAPPTDLPKKDPVGPDMTLYVLKGESFRSGDTLEVGQGIVSPGKKYMLVVQSDGNVVAYNLTSKAPIWSTGTQGRAPSKRPYMINQRDGNIVLMEQGGTILWALGKQDKQANLNIQDDGNIVYYDATSSAPLWSSNTIGK